MNDRTALVTGANKGIGKEIARLLAAQGAAVHLGSRDAERGRRAAEEIGHGARPLVLDVTDGAAIERAAAQLDRLDVLVNNAGIAPSLAPPQETGLEEFLRTYETNVHGVLAVTNALLPALRRSPQPRIVNISSGTASLSWSTDPDHGFSISGGGGAAYRCSKAALNALTVFYSQALAQEGFKVNALAPGLRATDLNARAAAGGDPAEVAPEAVRLASLPADGPTGSFLSWDGTSVPW